MPTIIIANNNEPLIPRSAIPNSSISVVLPIKYNGVIPERMRRPLGHIVYKDNEGKVVGFYNKKLDWLVVASQEVADVIMRSNPPVSMIEEIIRLAAAYIAASRGPAKASPEEAEICGVPASLDAILDNAERVRECIAMALKKLFKNAATIHVAGLNI